MVVFSKNALGIGTAVRTDVWHRDCSDFFFPDECPKDAGHLTHPIKKKTLGSYTRGLAALGVVVRQPGSCPSRVLHPAGQALGQIGV